MRTLAELLDTQEPGFPQVQEWIATATNPATLLSCEAADGERTLLALQVTTRSPLGALAYQSGGVLVDHGWLRILGAGHPRLPRALDTWNQLSAEVPRLPGALLVGDDAAGGFFALNGGGLPGASGRVLYYAPDTLSWEDLELGYSAWLRWALSGDLARFYENMRWPSWREESASLAGDRAFSIVPGLFTKGLSPAERSRRAVPLEELFDLYTREYPRKLARRH